MRVSPNGLTDKEVADYVRSACHRGKLVAWDGCHKIYVALDDIEARWFEENYPNTFVGSPDDMVLKIVEWYDASCPLRLVSGVRHNDDDPNAGFVDLIPQLFEDEDGCLVSS